MVYLNRGHPQTTWSKFRLFLTPPPPFEKLLRPVAKVLVNRISDLVNFIKNRPLNYYHFIGIT